MFLDDFEKVEKKFLVSIKKDRNVKVLEKFKKHFVVCLGFDTFKYLHDALCAELGANVTMEELYNDTGKMQRFKEILEEVTNDEDDEDGDKYESIDKLIREGAFESLGEKIERQLGEIYQNEKKDEELALLVDIKCLHKIIKEKFKKFDHGEGKNIYQFMELSNEIANEIDRYLQRKRKTRYVYSSLMRISYAFRNISMNRLNPFDGNLYQILLFDKDIQLNGMFDKNEKNAIISKIIDICKKTQSQIENIFHNIKQKT
ncbi:MAG: hypothetical protein Q4B84_02110 [Clostridia bacterium]|nr:hypothetical protein [Clostridia bacterium]